MQATYIFDVDPDRHLVHIVMAGFFRPEDIVRFRVARDQAHEALRCGRNQHVTLVDIRRMHIQSQEAVVEFGKLFADPTHASKALAIVVSRSLARLQVQRAAASRDVGYFAEDVAEAERWLLHAN